jgi:hypothetical protein
MFKRKQNTIINIKPKSTKILPSNSDKNGKEYQRFITVGSSGKFSENKNLTYKDTWVN